MKPALETRKRVSSAERETQILEVATRLFSLKGYSGTTTKAIAEACEINEALLFRHFPNKKCLYETLLEKMLEKWRTEVVPILEPLRQLSLKKALFRISQVVVDYVSQDSTLMRTMLHAALEDYKWGQNFLSRPLPLNVFMEKFFSERIQKKEIRRVHPVLASTTFLSMLFHYLLIKEVYKSPDLYGASQEKTLEFFVDTLLRGLELV